MLHLTTHFFKPLQLQTELESTRRQLEGVSAKGEELSRQLGETKQAYTLADQVSAYL